MVVGINLRKVGIDVDGIFVFVMVVEVVVEMGAIVLCVFILVVGVYGAVIEVVEGGVEFIVVIIEGVPVYDEVDFYN